MKLISEDLRMLELPEYRSSTRRTVGNEWSHESVLASLLSPRHKLKSSERGEPPKISSL